MRKIKQHPHCEEQTRRSNPYHAIWITSLTLAMTACGGGTYKTPSVSNPQSMSGETLCYRYAYAKDDPAIKAEIEARNLDCNKAFELEIGGEGRYY